MPPEDTSPALAHDEELYTKHGEGLSKDQHLRVYGLAYEYGHSAGDNEIEQYYMEFADFARDLLNADN